MGDGVGVGVGVGEGGGFDGGVVGVVTTGCVFATVLLVLLAGFEPPQPRIVAIINAIKTKKNRRQLTSASWVSKGKNAEFLSQ